MIATPEQHRTLADLIERGPVDSPVVGIVMYGANMLVAYGEPFSRRPSETARLTRIYPDGTFDKPKFLDAETMR